MKKLNLDAFDNRFIGQLSALLNDLPQETVLADIKSAVIEREKGWRKNVIVLDRHHQAFEICPVCGSQADRYKVNISPCTMTGDESKYVVKCRDCDFERFV